MRLKLSLVVAGALWLASLPVHAAAPCCGVTAVDTKSAVVTAQDKATLRTFQVKVDNAVLLQRVRIGQPVDADFGTGKAAIEGVGRFAIVGASTASAPPLAAAPKPAPAPPAQPAAPQPTKPIAAVPQATPPVVATAPAASVPPTQPAATSAGKPLATSPQPALPAAAIPQPANKPVASIPHASPVATLPTAPATHVQPAAPALDKPATAGPLASAPAVPATTIPTHKAPVAQPPHTASEGPAHHAAGPGGGPGCCVVTAVDTRTRIVAARDNASKHAFQFQVDNPVLANRIQPGHLVDADFAAGKASVHGVSGRFAILGGAHAMHPAPLNPGAHGRKPYTLPTVSAAAAQPRSERDRGRGAVPGQVRQLKGLEDIDGDGSLPESAKIILMMHAGTLPENASDHYIVNADMAREWAKTHAVPPEMKPKKKKKKKKKCDWTHSGGCADKVKQTTQDVWDSASEEWKRAWKANTKQLAQAWGELEECFVDHTLKASDIPVKFSIAPSFPVSVTRSGSSSSASGTSSGSATGTVTVGLPMEGDFRAQVELFYVPCIPFAVRPKSVGADGSMLVAARLGVQITANGDFKSEHTIPPGGGPAIPIAVLPIVIGGIPVATLDVAVYVDGTLKLGGEGQLDARFVLTAPYKAQFDFNCDGKGCGGRMKNVPVPTSVTENVVVKGKVHAKPAIYTALQLSLNFDALSGRAGAQPYLYGEVRGCSATAGIQDTSGQSTLTEYHALAADLDWGLEFRAEGLVAGEQVESYIRKVMDEKHIWFGDIAPGGSTAMVPAIAGPARLGVGQSGEYRFQSRPCYPFKDSVDYRVAWTGPAAAGAASGTRPVSMRPGSSADTSSCDWSANQGTCTLKPGADGSLQLAWPQPGSYKVSVTAVKDRHGRSFQGIANQIDVTVQ